MNVFEGAFEKGKEILKKLRNSKRKIVFQSKELKTAASLFVACKMTQIKKDVKEIAFVTGTNSRDIERCSNKINKLIPEQFRYWNPQ